MPVEEAVFAVVRTGGKQYRVQEGGRVRVDRLPGEPGASIELTDVLLMGEGNDVTVGAPTVAGARVLGTIAEQGRAKKIIVFRYKSKTRARKKTGHRQHFTTIIVDDILAAGQQPKPKAVVEEPAAAEPAEAEAEPKARGRGRRKPAAEATAAEPKVAAPEAVGTGPAEAAAGEASPPEAADSEAASGETTAAPEAAAGRPKRSRKKAE
ncbi:MAG: 50S ribosomal protein L21 [Dehalococcoidia bacterium]|nr:50S ribosomal protein L21 [Dehalococcoidia bacterium]